MVGGHSRLLSVGAYHLPGSVYRNSPPPGGVGPTVAGGRCHIIDGRRWEASCHRPPSVGGVMSSTAVGVAASGHRPSSVYGVISSTAVGLRRQVIDRRRCCGVRSSTVVGLRRHIIDRRRFTASYHRPPSVYGVRSSTAVGLRRQVIDRRRFTASFHTGLYPCLTLSPPARCSEAEASCAFLRRILRSLSIRPAQSPTCPCFSFASFPLCGSPDFDLFCPFAVHSSGAKPRRIVFSTTVRGTINCLR